VFEYALSMTTGQDLAKVLWLNSPNAEVWLDRRTNYTRSMATVRHTMENNRAGEKNYYVILCIFCLTLALHSLSHTVFLSSVCLDVYGWLYIRTETTSGKYRNKEM
jgi:hypothetical protein